MTIREEARRIAVNLGLGAAGEKFAQMEIERVLLSTRTAALEEAATLVCEKYKYNGHVANAIRSLKEVK